MSLSFVGKSDVASSNNYSFFKNYGSILSCITILCLSVIGIALAHSIVLGGITGFIIAGIAAFILLCVLSLTLTFVISKLLSKTQLDKSKLVDDYRLDDSILVALGRVCGKAVEEKFRSFSELSKEDFNIILDLVTSDDPELIRAIWDSLDADKTDMIRDLQTTLSNIDGTRKKNLKVLLWLIQFESKGKISRSNKKGFNALLSNHLYKDLFDEKIIGAASGLSRTYYEKLQNGYLQFGVKDSSYLDNLSFRLLTSYQIIDRFKYYPNLPSCFTIDLMGGTRVEGDLSSLDFQDYFDSNFKITCEEDQLNDLMDPNHPLNVYVEGQLRFLNARTKGLSQKDISNYVLKFLHIGFSYEQVMMLINLVSEDLTCYRQVLREAFA